MGVWFLSEDTARDRFKMVSYVLAEAVDYMFIDSTS